MSNLTTKYLFVHSAFVRLSWHVIGAPESTCARQSIEESITSALHACSEPARLSLYGTLFAMVIQMYCCVRLSFHLRNVVESTARQYGQEDYASASFIY